MYKRDLEQRYRELLYINEREYDNADKEELEELRNALTPIPEEYPPQPSLADSIAVSQVGLNSYANAQPLLDRLVIFLFVRKHCNEKHHCQATGKKRT